eukprot:m.68102 g.68102  ORF g.68102 m.68102 type:complete len:300 (-) comp23912_c1_seq1:103-1002(-)
MSECSHEGFRRRDGEVAVITGGASGIGAACAESWIERGGTVVVCDINITLGEEFEAKYPKNSRFIKCDTTVESDVEAAAVLAVQLGPLTCWMNNAGIAVPNDDVASALDGFSSIRKLLDVNVVGNTLGAFVALKYLDPTREGVIITTSSLAGTQAAAFGPCYSMSKAANIHFTRCIAKGLDATNSNVRVYALCPGFTSTPILNDLNESLSAPVAAIISHFGAVMTVQHQAHAFLMLAQANLPSGSILRVVPHKSDTLHGMGASVKVVYDVVKYAEGTYAPEGTVLHEVPLPETLMPSRL